MPWNYKQFGSASDPVHKSHLNAITGDYGCPKQFRYEMDALVDARALEGGGAAERTTISGKAACGTAAHETIARALNKHDLRNHLLRGRRVAQDSVRAVFVEELERERGGRELQWYGKDDEADVIAEVVAMVTGLLNDLHTYVAFVELCEAGFIAPCGDLWMCGHIDLVYRPKANPRSFAMADWKTGASKPDPIELDHGWEAGAYSNAVRHGIFIPRESISTSTAADGGTTATLGPRSCTHPSRYIAERMVMEAALIDIAQELDALKRPALAEHLETARAYNAFEIEAFPTEIYHVHLADYVPYRKAGKKGVKRPEDLKFYGYESEQKAHQYKAGDMRGPAWLPVQLTEFDIPRLQARLRNVVRMIRMGCFIDQVGERCKRCMHRDVCLTAGYAPTGNVKRELERALRTVRGGDGLAEALEGMGETNE